MAQARKTILTCAVTGGIHTPSLSPYLPWKADDLIAQAVDAHAAGAAVIHLHGRDQQDGRPSVDKDLMRRVLCGIKERCDAVVCISTAAGLGMSLEERISVVPLLKPEVATLNAGSLNFYIGGLARKLDKAEFDWERPYVTGTEDYASINTFKALAFFAKTMDECGTHPEIEVYDPGMINNVAYLVSQGLLRKPIHIQYVLGILGGIHASVDSLVFMHRTARDLLGDDIIWSCAAAGRDQFPIVSAAIAMGGNGRVGLEDNLYLRPGQLARSNAEQVAQLRVIAENMGREIATSNDVRQMIGLKGRDQVAC